MDRGYVKLWRRSLDHPLFKKPLTWHLWGYCLQKASHKDTDVFLNGQTIHVKKGSFIFGRKKAAEETGLSERQIRTALQHLEKLQNLTIRTTNRFSIISIVNWDAYQARKHNNDQQNDQLPTSYRPATDHIQECKEIYSDKLHQFVSRFIEFIKTNNPKQMPKTKRLRENSLKEVDMLIRIDGFDLEYIRQVIGWAVQDDFWGNQVFSLAGLRRKSKNGLTKFQNISAAYDKNHKTEKIERVSVYQVAEEDL